MKKPKLNPQVFRDAAELIEIEQRLYACVAINYSSDIKKPWISDVVTAYETYFAKWFKPEGKIQNESCYGWFGKGSVEANKKKRVLALLLCADILERQNKKK